jgi:hypothetical protein
MIFTGVSAIGQYVISHPLSDAEIGDGEFSQPCPHEPEFPPRKQKVCANDYQSIFRTARPPEALSLPLIRGTSACPVGRSVVKLSTNRGALTRPRRRKTVYLLRVRVAEDGPKRRLLPPLTWSRLGAKLPRQLVTAAAVRDPEPSFGAGKRTPWNRWRSFLRKGEFPVRGKR